MVSENFVSKTVFIIFFWTFIFAINVHFLKVKILFKFQKCFFHYMTFQKFSTLYYMVVEKIRFCSLSRLNIYYFKLLKETIISENNIFSTIQI